jgi:hypothetical protein
MKINNFSLFIPLIFLFACKGPESKKNLEGYRYEKLEIPISEDFNPDRTRNQYYESDSGEFLAILNKTKFSIRIYNLGTQELAKVIPLTKEGPNGIGLDNGFLLISNDTILIATIPPKIRLLNFKGELMESISLENKSNDVNFLSSTNVVPFLYTRKILFGIQPFLDNFFEITEKEASSIPPIFSVDFSKPNFPVEWLPINRPEGFWKEGKKDENLSWTERGDSIIVAPYTDHKVWIISKKQKKLLDVIECKSTYINNFHILEKDELGGDKGIIQSLEHDRYEIIMYDKFRDVFYRMFFPKIDLTNFNYTPRQLFSNRPLIGVLILNKELAPIGEYIFDNHQVQTWNYFVGHKGLYVSTNNPNRDDFDENFLRYDIIRFGGLNYKD